MMLQPRPQTLCFIGHCHSNQRFYRQIVSHHEKLGHFPSSCIDLNTCMFCSLVTQLTAHTCVYITTALKRNVPGTCIDPDSHFIRQSLKPYQVHVSNPLYYEDDARCTSTSEC